MRRCFLIWAKSRFRNLDFELQNHQTRTRLENQEQQISYKILDFETGYKRNSLNLTTTMIRNFQYAWILSTRSVNTKLMQLTKDKNVNLHLPLHYRNSNSSIMTSDQKQFLHIRLFNLTHRFSQPTLLQAETIIF